MQENKNNQVGVVTAVQFDQNQMNIVLSDSREVTIPIDKIPWLRWLVKATPEQKSNWSIEPGGVALYWEDLDDGVEISHLLGMEPITP